VGSQKEDQGGLKVLGDGQNDGTGGGDRRGGKKLSLGTVKNGYSAGQCEEIFVRNPASRESGVGREGGIVRRCRLWGRPGSQACSELGLRGRSRAMKESERVQWRVGEGNGKVRIPSADGPEGGGEDGVRGKGSLG